MKKYIEHGLVLYIQMHPLVILLAKMEKEEYAEPSDQDQKQSLNKVVIHASNARI
jgi:hypothetical protein